MLHLVSKHSLRKANPTKERELALQLEREREDEILIPLNVDGTRPSDLPWRIIDVAYIPFQNWASGLAQLLKKLGSVNTPRPLAGSGREIAGSAFLMPSAVHDTQEIIESNVFPFTAIPALIRHFHFSQKVLQNDVLILRKAWAFRNLDGKRALAFANPPVDLRQSGFLEEEKNTDWREKNTIEGIPSGHLVSELLGKSIELHCLSLGLIRDPRRGGLFFPFSLLPKNTIRFGGYQGKQTRILACGYRKFSGLRYRYHLAPWFRVRNDFDMGFVMQLRLHIHLTDEDGTALEERAAFARRKKIGAGWWNGHWLNRQRAVMAYLSNGHPAIRIGDDPKEQVILASVPITKIANRGIDERLLMKVDAPLGLVTGTADDDREAEQ